MKPERLCIKYVVIHIGASRAASLFRFSCMLNIWCDGARHVQAIGPCGMPCGTAGAGRVRVRAACMRFRRSARI